jgi:hypothetical protein
VIVIIINPPPQMLVGRIDKEKKTVIFEVGFSEGYEDLMFDKEQWLSKNKYVRLVVIVDIKENTKSDGKRQNVSSESTGID